MKKLYRNFKDLFVIATIISRKIKKALAPKSLTDEILKMFLCCVLIMTVSAVALLLICN